MVLQDTGSGLQLSKYNKCCRGRGAAESGEGRRLGHPVENRARRTAQMITHTSSVMRDGKRFGWLERSWTAGSPRLGYLRTVSSLMLWRLETTLVGSVD